MESKRYANAKKPTPIWEPFWVTSVECLNYIIQLASNSYRFEMADGALINVTSSIGTYNFTVIH